MYVLRMYVCIYSKFNTRLPSPFIYIHIINTYRLGTGGLELKDHPIKGNMGGGGGVGKICTILRPFNYSKFSGIFF